MIISLHKSISAIVVALVFSGCAGMEPTPLTAKHPASGQAAEGAIFRPAPLTDETTQRVTEQLARAKPEQEFAKPPSPQHRADEMEHKTPQQAAGDGAYTCPMHPEVESDQPGECPKCGMDLVGKESSHSDH